MSSCDIGVETALSPKKAEWELTGVVRLDFILPASCTSESPAARACGANRTGSEHTMGKK